jgi:hypothetical protein
MNEVTRILSDVAKENTQAGGRAALAYPSYVRRLAPTRTVVLSTLWRAIAALGLGVNNVLRSAKRDRPDVAARRQRWRDAQPSLGPKGPVFLGQTWATTNAARRQRRAPVGERPIMSQLRKLG